MGACAPAPCGWQTSSCPDTSDSSATIDAIPNYTHRAQWSVESGDYVGTCLGFGSESANAPTAHEAIAAVERSVADIVAGYAADDVDPPPSLTDRRYSGSFLVRTSRDLHGRLMVESAEQGISLNQWVAQKLADRGPGPSLDSWF